MRRIASTFYSESRRPISRQELDHSPLIAFYEITQACELACTHCRARAQPFRSSDELTPDEGRKLVDQLTQFPRPPALVVTGGDPLVRPDLCRLVEYATGKGLEVAVTPAVTERLTEYALQQLLDAGVARIALSLDGANAETHDGIRGIPGSYDRTWDAIAMARSLGMSVQINTTLMRCNFHQLDEIAEHLEGPKIVLWSVFFVVPVGRADRLQRISAAEYEIAFEKLWQHSQSKPYLIKTTEAPHYRRYVLQHLRESNWIDLHSAKAFKSIVRWASLGINDGKGVMFVSHTGAIYPSGFLPVVAGQFPEDHLVDIYQHSPVFLMLRNSDRLQGKCAVCEYRAACGGSRARAFAVTGNVLAQEPDCDYLPRVMQEPSAVG